MSLETADRACALLAQSLAVWRVDGTVRAGEPPVVAIIRAQETRVQVEIASESESPIRWWVRWNDLGADGARSQARSRPCASAVGLLRTVREALSVEASRRLRIAPSSLDA